MFPAVFSVSVLPGNGGREGRSSDSSGSKILKKKKSEFVTGNKSESKEPFISEVNKHILKGKMMHVWCGHIWVISGCNKILGFLGATSKLEVTGEMFCKRN
jgi:hypothetical protein